MVPWTRGCNCPQADAMHLCSHSLDRYMNRARLYTRKTVAIARSWGGRRFGLKPTVVA
jgi:hypothetical protein